MAFIFTNTKITIIHGGAFGLNTSVTEITFKDSAIDTIGTPSTSSSELDSYNPNVFSYCRNLQSLDLSTNTLWQLKHRAFWGCEKLNYVNFENATHLINIGPGAFRGCKQLAELTHIHDCVELYNIGDGAFGYTGFVTVDLSNMPKLRYLGSATTSDMPAMQGAFADCTNLISIDISNNPEMIGIGKVCFIGSTLQSFKCENNPALQFGEQAFNGLTTLTEVNIGNCTAPTGVSTRAPFIGRSAFNGCKNLTTIIGWDLYKQYCTNIDAAAFCNCAKFNEDISNMPLCSGFGDGSFAGCAALTSNIENLPVLERIGESAFEGCKLLGDIDLHDQTALTSIEGFAFAGAKCNHVNLSGCTNLETVGYAAVWAKNTLYGSSASSKIIDITFDGCTKLKFGDDLFQQTFFQATSLQSISMKNCPIVDIPTSFVHGCTALQSIDFTGHQINGKIGDHAFDGCSALATLQSFDSAVITSVGTSAFNNCGAIPSLKFPNSLVTTVGASAFQNVRSCTDIELHFANTASDHVGNQAFTGLGTSVGGCKVNIYATTPPEVDDIGTTETGTTKGKLTWRISGNTVAGTEFHFNASAESAYKAKANALETAGPIVKRKYNTTTDVSNCIAWWCCSNGALSTTTGGNSGDVIAQVTEWYTGSPAILFDLI